jgi:hypothetical protein
MSSRSVKSNKLFMKKYLVIFFITLMCQGTYAQGIPYDSDASARVSQSNADATITFNYDASGNRIKRAGGATTGCVNIWTGNVNDQWSNAENWSLGIIPQPCHKVSIPALTTKPYPILNINTSISGIIFDGGTIIMNTNIYTLTLSTDPGCVAICP